MTHSQSILVTAAEMRQLEALSVEQGATWSGLMQEAGHGVAQVALAELPQPVDAHVLVLVGPGNNGGDALIAAAALHDAGVRVQVYLWRRTTRADDPPWTGCEARQIPTLHAHDDPHTTALARRLHAAQLVIDGLLGVGVNRELGADVQAIVAQVNAAGRQVLAVDVPSGLDADTGAIRGAMIHANITVATGLFKRGHRLYPGAAWCGRLVLAPIRLPSRLETRMQTTELNLETLRSLMPARPQDGHKGTFGKVLVVAGSYFYPGAAVLSASAAARSGAGLVTLACPRSIDGASAAALHEATYLPLPEAEPGALSIAAAEAVMEKMASYNALLVGCGLGQEDATKDFLGQLLGLDKAKRRGGVGFLAASRKEDEHGHHRRGGVGFLSSNRKETETEQLETQAEEAKLPALVLDADGLNLLAKFENWAERLRDHPTILTPHPREMARLLGEDDLGEDHPQIAAEAAARWGVVVVLKGAHTIVAAPDGRISIHSAANPALATAGTGDVLAGLTAGLLAQGLEPFAAAQLGVGLHGVAGALVRNQLGDRGVIAGDVLQRLPEAFQHVVKA